MFNRKSKQYDEGVLALQALAKALEEIASSLEVLKRIEPKIEAIYEAYNNLNP